MPTFQLSLVVVLLLGAAIVLFVEAFARPGIERLRPLAFGLVALAAAFASAF